jgi:hypothetical protein
MLTHVLDHLFEINCQIRVLPAYNAGHHPYASKKRQKAFMAEVSKDSTSGSHVLLVPQ